MLECKRSLERYKRTFNILPNIALHSFGKRNHRFDNHHLYLDLKMSILAVLKRSLAPLETPKILRPSKAQYPKAKLTQLPDELLEMITTLLNRRSLCNLRLANKRLVLKTTHLIAARCHSNRACVDATHSFDILIEGSRLPLLSGTITSLTLSAPSWKSPLALYGAGLREIHLPRLTSLTLYQTSILKVKDLLHFLAAHASTLQNLHLISVHLPSLQSWKTIFTHLAKLTTHHLHTLELVILYYTVTNPQAQPRIFILPRSSYQPSISSTADVLDDPPRPGATAHTGREISLLLGDFFTVDGELKKDFGHEEMLLLQEKDKGTNEASSQSLLKKLARLCK